MCNHNHDYVNMSSEDLGSLPYDCFFYPGEIPLIESYGTHEYIDYIINGSISHSTLGPSTIVFEKNKVNSLEFYFHGNLYRENGPAIIYYNINNGKIIQEKWFDPKRIGFLPQEITYSSDGKIISVCYGNTNRWGDYDDCVDGPAEVNYTYHNNELSMKKRFFVNKTHIGDNLKLYSSEEIKMCYENFKILL